MTKVRLLILFISIFYAVNSNALSTDAIEGKSLYPACNVCHNPAMDPPMAPPMWGVQRRYNRNTLDREDFIETMVDFVKAPTMEKAIHDQALGQLGLMPPMPLPELMLKKISTYIFEEQFPPPCEHWRVAVERATKSGDLDHAKKDKKMLQRFCK